MDVGIVIGRAASSRSRWTLFVIGTAVPVLAAVVGIADAVRETASLEVNRSKP